MHKHKVQPHIQNHPESPTQVHTLEDGKLPLSYFFPRYNLYAINKLPVYYKTLHLQVAQAPVACFSFLLLGFRRNHHAGFELPF